MLLLVLSFRCQYCKLQCCYGCEVTNTSGLRNTAVGNEALFSSTTGNSNTAVGDRSLDANTTGAQNTAGSETLSANTTGGYNVAIGDAHGKFYNFLL